MKKEEKSNDSDYLLRSSLVFGIGVRYDHAKTRFQNVHKPNLMRFYIKAMLELYSDLVDQIGLQTDQETTQTDQETTQTDQEKGNSDQETTQTDQEKNPSDQLAYEKLKIFQLLKANPQITRVEIAKAIGLHDSSVKRRIESLIAEGLIRRIGSTKGGHWEIINLESR